MAKLTQITIGGFKSISAEHPISLNMGDVTVILGANGAGKSNIISFFKMLNYMMSGGFSSFVALNRGCQSLMCYGPKKTPQIFGKLQFQTNRCDDVYEFTLSFVAPDGLVVSDEKVEYKTRDDLYATPRQIRLNHLYNESALSQPTSDRTLQVIHNILSRCKVYQFHDSSSTADMRNSCDVDANNYLYAEAGNLAAYLYRIKKEFCDSYDNILRYIQMVVPQFRDFLLEPDTNHRIMLKWMDMTGSEYIYLPTQFSDGSMRFIALATLLLQPREIMPNVIIIDEPELGLHPYAIGLLAEMIKEASKHTQIIVATQSPALVDEFKANQVVVVETEQEHNQFYSIAKRLDANDLSAWLSEFTISELWEKNVIGGRPQ